MESDEFRKNAHQLVDWMADYLSEIESFPVKSQVAPGEIITRLPALPPGEAEPFHKIMDDFKEVIIPGMTHWQHPSWHGYFTANNSYPSILAEMLTATLGAQCMSWITSPAATELEEMMMKWLLQMYGLPSSFTGVIQDTASTATLCAILSARERISGFEVNHSGLYLQKQLVVYCSSEAHSSIEKAVKIAGLGKQNLRKIPVGDKFGMLPELFEKYVEEDIRSGLIPLIVIAAFGTTGSTAIDPLEKIIEIARPHNIWVHVDAAWAGTALILPENLHFSEQLQPVDSVVINPHKWMFTNFDCSAYFVKDQETLIRTFEILPEYLKTPVDQRVNNYRDWGIQLGRRFRALKLWFVIRSFGVEGLRNKIRDHIAWAKELASEIEQHHDFELLAPAGFAVVCFRYHPENMEAEQELNRMNAALLEKINQSGKLFMSHTSLAGKFTLRFVVGQTNTQRKHVQQAWKLIQELAEEI